jgi:hypothetical protein
MQSEAEKTEKGLHWKWIIGFWLVIFGDRALQAINVPTDLSFALAAFGLFHICYWYPPKTNIAYGRLVLWLMGILGWYVLIPRLVYYSLETRIHYVWVFLIALILSLGAPLGIFLCAKSLAGKKDDCTRSK